MSMKKITLLTKDKFKLAGLLNLVENPIGAVIFVHGMTGEIKTEYTFRKIANLLHEQNIATIQFDIRGHGNSQGVSEKDFTISGAIEDLRTIHDYIRKLGNKNISIVANSLGAGITTLFVLDSKIHVKSLCFTNPVLDFSNSFIHPHSQWMKSNFDSATEQLNKNGYILVGYNKYRIGSGLYKEFGKFNPAKKLYKITCQTLIIQGLDDIVVLPESVNNQIQEANNHLLNLVQIPGGSHGLYEDPYSMKTAILSSEFIVKTLRS